MWGGAGGGRGCGIGTSETANTLGGWAILNLGILKDCEKHSSDMKP